MSQVEVRQLKSGKWVCEVVRQYKFLGFTLYETRNGLSEILNEWRIGSRNYALYCIGSEQRARSILATYADRFGE